MARSRWRRSICRVSWSGVDPSQGTRSEGTGSQGTGMVSKQIESRVAFHSRSGVSAGLVPVERSSGFGFVWFPIEQPRLNTATKENRFAGRWSSLAGNWSKSRLSGHRQLASIELLRETFTGGPQAGIDGRRDHRVSIGLFLNSLTCVGNSHGLTADRRCRPLPMLAGSDTGSSSGFSSCSWKHQ